MLQSNTNVVQDKTRLGDKKDPLGTVQGIKICPYCQLVYAQTRISTKKIL